MRESRVIQRFDDVASVDDEQLLEVVPTGAVRWNLVLVWFMRLVALAWIAKGLIAWSTILGISPGGVAFEGASTGFQATVIYFAVVDIVAGIGLWLVSTWGGVLWLLAVMSHLILAVFFPRFVAQGALVIGLFIASIMIYLILSWLAAIEE